MKNKDLVLNKAKSRFFIKKKEGVKLTLDTPYNTDKADRQVCKLLRQIEVIGYARSFRFCGSTYYDLSELKKHFETEDIVSTSL